MKKRILTAIVWSSLVLAFPFTLVAQAPNYRTFREADADTKALVQKVVAALGGESNLAKLRSVKKVASIEQKSGNGSLRTEFTGIAVFPNNLYAKMQLPQGEITAVSSPQSTHLYRQNAPVKGAALKLNEDEKLYFIRYFMEDPILLLQNRIDPRYLFARGSRTKINGRDTDQLYVHVSNFDIQWFVDSETGRIVRTVAGDKVADYEDWRNVSGFNLPFTAKTVEGKNAGRVVCHSYEFNPAVDTAQLFARPTLWTTRTPFPASGKYNRGGSYDYYGTSEDSYYRYRSYEDSSDWGTYVYYLYIIPLN
jgi:hypothetical protein